MGMLSERLQILLEPAQRALLDRESKRSGRPIGELVREAVEARYGGAPKRRRAAVRAMRAVEPAGPELEPDEIEQLIRAEHDG